MNTRWTWLFHGDFPTFPLNPCMAVSCPPVPSRLEFGGEGHMLKPHIEWKLHFININIIIHYTITTCYYSIRLDRLCGCFLSPSAFVCLQTFLLQAFWLTLVSCAWFPGGWCGRESRRVRRSATACFFLKTGTGTASINFPKWHHRWWSNFCELKRRGYTWKHHRSLLWVASILDEVKFHVWQCVYLLQAAGPSGLSFLSRRFKLAGIHIYWNLRTRLLDMFDSIMYIRCNNLSFDLAFCNWIGFPGNFPPSAALRKL